MTRHAEGFAVIHRRQPPSDLCDEVVGVDGAQVRSHLRQPCVLVVQLAVHAACAGHGGKEFRGRSRSGQQVEVRTAGGAMRRATKAAHASAAERLRTHASCEA
jgi:hypothetical protein